MYDEKKTRERYGGLTPKQLIEFKGLAGDSTDNIPGVRGIGEKTAIQLLLEYETIEKLYKALEQGKTDFAPKLEEKLLKGKEQAFMSRELGRIRTDVAMKVSFPDLVWREFDEVQVKNALEEFNFTSLIARMGELKGREPAEQQAMFESPKGAAEQTKEDIEKLYQDKVISKEIYDLENNLSPILRSMEKKGIKIDLAYFAKLEKELAAALKKAEGKIHAMTDKEFNISSPKQLAEVLFEDLQLPIKGIKKTPGGAISTASSELEKLEPQHEVVSQILLYRELSKLYTTYVVPLPQLADKNGRIHTHFDQLGAATGRMSSSKPNLQQIPNQGDWGKRIREGFVSEKKKSLVSFDYSQ
ncbi:MAG: DNA polymerase, partial [archaeon]|nr:DNA polymerase [archaeon]